MHFGHPVAPGPALIFVWIFMTSSSTSLRVVFDRHVGGAASLVQHSQGPGPALSFARTFMRPAAGTSRSSPSHRPR